MEIIRGPISSGPVMEWQLRKEVVNFFDVTQEHYYVGYVKDDVFHIVAESLSLAAGITVYDSLIAQTSPEGFLDWAKDYE